MSEKWHQTFLLHCSHLLAQVNPCKAWKLKVLIFYEWWNYCWFLIQVWLPNVQEMWMACFANKDYFIFFFWSVSAFLNPQNANTDSISSFCLYVSSFSPYLPVVYLKVIESESGQFLLYFRVLPISSYWVLPYGSSKRWTCSHVTQTMPGVLSFQMSTDFLYFLLHMYYVLFFVL